jgi:hypothetical protein
MKKIIALFAMLLFFNTLNAQVSEYYYSDTEQKEGGKIFDHLKYDNTIIIAGKSFDKVKNKPAIIRIDTLGNTMWNTSLNDNSTYITPNAHVDKLIMGMDGYIYATCFDYDVTNNNRSLWKVDPQNGTIVWKKSLNFGLGYNIPRLLVDFDSTKFIYPYNYSYDGITYTVKYSFISKTNGNVLATYQIGQVRWQHFRFGLYVDNQKNIYYSKEDTLIKVEGSNPNNILWKVQYSSANVTEINHIYFDTTSASVFFLGEGRIVKINAANGSFISSCIGTNEVVKHIDSKVVNEFMYISWQHLYVGGSVFPVNITKYNMLTGSISWHQYYVYNGVGVPASHSAECSAGMSLDIDSSGNIYLTGYYNDANYGPENWGILKINGTNGNVIYEKTITEDTAVYDDLSVGMASCMINNSPYFVGELETYNPQYLPREHLAFVRLDPATGNTVLNKYIEGIYQFPSKTLYIENYPPSQTIVMKQIGRAFELEMYDFTKNLIWEKLFEKEYYLEGGNLAIAPNGDIYVSAHSKSESNTSPYYGSNTDSIFVFHLNGSGNLIKKYSFYIGLSGVFPAELYAENSGAFLFYSKSNIMYYRKIASSVLSPEYNSQITYNDVISNTKHYIDKSTTKALLFGKITNTTRLMELNKNSMAITNLAVIPTVFKNIYYTLEIDTSRVIVCATDWLTVETIGLYNTTIKDTIWTKRPSNWMYPTLKCVADPQNNFIYSISNGFLDITVRKNAISTGQQKWAYQFDRGFSMDEGPVDIAYDATRNQLLVVGYELYNGSKQAIILVLDTAGIAQDTIIKAGDFAGDNYGLCAHVLYDGSQWAGGNLNLNPYGLAGFIYEIAGTHIITGNLLHQNDACKIKISPNPFSNTAQIEICPTAKQGNIQLLLFNIYGQPIKYFSIPNSEPFEINRNGLPSGVYIYQLISENKTIDSGKIIIVD